MTNRDLMSYVTTLGALFYVLSSFTDDTNSQPIPRWHRVNSLTQDRINIRIHFVREIG